MQHNMTKAEFVRAIVGGNLSAVEQYLRDHPDSINFKYDGNMTALMLAAYHGQTSIVAALIEQPNIDINIATPDGRTAADIANERGHHSIGVALENSPAIHWFVGSTVQSTNEFELDLYGDLYGDGDDVTQPVTLNLAPLAAALERYNHALNTEALINAISSSADQALTHPAILTTPASAASPDSIRHAPPERSELGDALVEFRRNFNRNNMEQNRLDNVVTHEQMTASITALMTAVRNNDVQQVTAILREHRHLNQIGYLMTDSENNQTALMIAARQGSTNIVRMLLGTLLAPSPIQDPLGIAFHQPRYEQVTDNEGRTALMHAAMAGHLEIAEMLLSLRHVDHGVRDLRGRSAAQLAENNGFQHIGEYIRGQVREELRRRLFQPSFFHQHGTTTRPQFDEDQATRERRLAVEGFMTAARHNDREAVNDFIAANQGRPYLSANLYAAAQVSHPDLTAHLMQLHSQLQHDAEQAQTSQENTPAPASTNRQAARLEACRFAGEVPEPLRDVSTLEMMDDPVTVSSGHTYERNSLKQLPTAVVNKVTIRNCIVCPISRACIPRSEADNPTNICMRNIIEDFVCTQEDPNYKSKLVRLLLCPLSRNIMHNPVTLACGLTVDRQALIALFARHKNPDTLKIDETLAVSRKELDTLKTNIAIQKLIASIPNEDFEAEIQKMVRERRQGLFVAAPSTDDINKGGAPAEEPRQKK
jgi:ankyrin repeat protein